MSDETELFKRGFENRKTVLGAGHVEKSWGSADDFNRPVQRMVTEVCWGGVWGDDTLPFRTRSMLNIGMMTAMNQHHELGVHVKGALTNGVGTDEIRAVLMQALVYCGAPATLAAFRTATKAIAEWEAEHGPAPTKGTPETKVPRKNGADKT
ncbi:carboxymuconolactone decarboxylase family protein [Acidimangrovimonas sediminis]|uniref:carboxymuconolactone decarboxylase family protein n=1 Tax=Acidimangrovimonas sediminis TaxID=2056283 RepID=UPI000C7FE3EB|nr:carboxymuconolactone decarboxylase family protein [Acidimangrovimonas sediminis]